MLIHARTICNFIISLILAHSTVGRAQPAEQSRCSPCEEVMSYLHPSLRSNEVLASGILRFYQSRNFQPAWHTEHEIHELLAAIRASLTEGLSPEDYGHDTLSNLNSIGPITDQLSAIDVHLTAAFLKLAHDLHEGKTDPVKLHPGDWDICIEPMSYPEVLQQALATSTIYQSLEELKPKDNEYRELKRWLSEFREINLSGGLQQIETGAAIVVNDIDDRIPAIRHRLSMLRLLPTDQDNQTTLYDSTLKQYVKKFQEGHGLRADGVIGKETQDALKLTADDYISVIVVNLERYRWHQSRLLDRSIKVNIPAYHMVLSDQKSIELQMKAIVGRPDRRTPALSSLITMLIINPTWTVPPTVLKEDVLPAVKMDLRYLEMHQMHLYDRHGTEVDPDSLPWELYSAENFPYTVREDAGPRNPLGLIKFFFPNDHTIYVHDTNIPSLFKEGSRALSSGCVRIESPMALARKLLDGTDVDDEMLRGYIEAGETMTLALKSPLPIHLVYFTAYTVNDGSLYMLRDVYDYDKVVLRALTSP